MVGGCCGTTPEHIRQLAEVMKDQIAPSTRLYSHESLYQGLNQSIVEARKSTVT